MQSDQRICTCAATQAHTSALATFTQARTHTRAHARTHSHHANSPHTSEHIRLYSGLSKATCRYFEWRAPRACAWLL